MKWTFLFSGSMSLLLSGCVYTESTNGRFTSLDVQLPTSSQTVIHKTITVNAPPGTVVNISEEMPSPPTIIYRDEHPTRHCYYRADTHQHVCY